jgi:hypothetical protein
VDYDWLPLAGLVVVTGVLLATGPAGFRRRDLVTE